MKEAGHKLIDALPESQKHRVSLNILLSERAEADDGIKKEYKFNIPEDYYNYAYNSRLFKKIVFYKLPCIKQIL